MGKLKASLKDYNVNSLPKTRKEQFSDIIKHNFSLLMKLGLLLLVFALPLLLSIVVKDVSLLTIVRSGEQSSETIYNLKFSTTIIFSITETISFLILSLGFSGVLKVLKELIYSEPVFLKADFKEGIKQNYKSMLVISLFVGIFTSISNIFLLVMNNDALKVIPFAFNYALIYPTCFIAMFLSSVYANRFIVTLKASLVFYIKYLPLILLTYLAFILLAFAKWIPLSLFYVKYIIFIFLLVFYYPLALLGGYLYQIHIYDVNINKTQYFEFYKKGLYIENEKTSNENKE